MHKTFGKQTNPMLKVEEKNRNSAQFIKKRIQAQEAIAMPIKVLK